MDERSTVKTMYAAYSEGFRLISDVQTAQGRVSETRTRHKTASSQHRGYEAIVKIWWRNKGESVCV